MLQINSNLSEPYKCNCSLCQRKGITMAAAPNKAIQITKGEKYLQKYQFNKNIAQHFFCKICGIYTHHKRRIDPTTSAINIACIHNINIDSLKPKILNGKNENTFNNNNSND